MLVTVSVVLIIGCW